MPSEATDVIFPWTQSQGATNRAHNVQIYGNKLIMYAKFLKVVQSFVRQYTFTFFRLL